jgi:hypothetical protein
VALFGEGAGGFVVSGSREALAALEEKGDVSVRGLGRVMGERLRIVISAEATVELSLKELGEAHSSLRELFA